jgi:hypothetical protein
MELRKSGKEMQKKKDKVEPKKWFYKCPCVGRFPLPGSVWWRCHLITNPLW